MALRLSSGLLRKFGRGTGALLAVVPILVGACWQPCCESRTQKSTVSAEYRVAPPQVAPASIEILPDRVQVLGAADEPMPRFELRVRLRDSQGNILPEYYWDWDHSSPRISINGPIEWEWADLVTTWVWNPSNWYDGYDGIIRLHHRALIETPSNVQNGSKLILRARYKTLEAEAEITVLRELDLTSGDAIMAAHTEAAPPSIALVSGMQGGNRVDYEEWAVVYGGALPNLVAGPTIQQTQFGDAVSAANTEWLNVALSRDGGAGALEETWAGAGDVIDFTPVAPASRIIPIRVWLAFDDPWTVAATRIDLARADVELAVAILNENRAGIEFVIEADGVQPLDPAVVTGMTGGCHTSTDDNSTPAALFVQSDPSLEQPNFDDRNMLHLIYVDHNGSRHGRTCGVHLVGDAPKSAIVIVDWFSYSPVTVAHEFGHVLGLHHVEAGADFGKTNVMSTYDLATDVDYAFYASRDHLSLGQVFRTSFFQASWLNYLVGADLVTSGLTRDCEDDTVQPDQCPPLEQDINGP